MNALEWIGRAVWEVCRGLGLIIRDIHRFFYRRLGARIWWIYIIIALVLLLWATGQLWNFVFSILTLALVLFGLYLIITAPFRGRRRERRERR